MAPDIHLRHHDAPLWVKILGSAGTYPHADNPCSGYLVQSPTTTLWVDTGPGTFAALLEEHSLADVDAILVTHEHPDHWVELPIIRNAATYVLDIAGIALFGTAGTKTLAEGVIGGDMAPAFDWTTLTDGSEVAIGDITVRCSRTDHPVETLAMRFESGGRVLAYSADTGPAWSFAELDPDGEGFDLALCEATLDPADAGKVQHLTAAQAGAMAAAAGVRRLALTHLYDGKETERADEASEPEAFDGPVEVARPGQTFTV